MKKIYIPMPGRAYTLGEQWFFDSKFWKVFVMCGISWTSDKWTKRGLSYLKTDKDEFDNKVKKFTEVGIEFTTEVSPSKWTYYINISSKKSNLALIDKLYIDWVKKIKLFAFKNNYTYYENWYYSEEAWSQLIQENERIMNTKNLFD